MNKKRKSIYKKRYYVLLAFVIIFAGFRYDIYMHYKSMQIEKNTSLHNHNITPMQYKALMDLYYTTGGENWTHNNNWGDFSQVTNWYGIDLDEDGNVISIALDNNNLIGKVPESIGTLSYIKTIDLSSNHITQLPNSIGNLYQLTNLSLAYNHLKTIPHHLNNLTSIELIDIRNNKIKLLPINILNLPALNYFYIDHNPLINSCWL